MAEFVQRRVEEQIPELEQLERVGLLTRGELRSVIKKRTAMEYKLKRRVVEKEDFIGYVQYEINFLELLKKRRQRIGYSYKKDEIEFVIVHRIHQLFSRATNKWKEDLQLWMSHIAFCKKWNCKSQMSKVFSSLLAVHADKAALWIMAAKWEFEDRLSAESSRHLFLRALRFHPEAPKLYQEYFRMELMNAEKQRNEKALVDRAEMDVGEARYSDAILNGQLARVVYKAAVEKISGAEFHLSLLNIAKKFPFAEELQKEILSDLQSLHADDPLTWDFLARQELSIKSSAEASSNQSKAQEAAQQEERCSQVYETALRSVHTEAMWDLYITFCLERYKRKTNSKELKQKRMERLLSALHKAHEAALLPQARYTEWVSHLVDLGQVTEAASVSSVATDRFASSVDVWRTRLEVLIGMKAAEVGEVFEKAMTQVKDGLPLWTMMVEWSEKERSAGDTEALYQVRGASWQHCALLSHELIYPSSRQRLVLNPNVTKTMKVKYLDWTYRSRGYKPAKKVFSSLHEIRPLSEEFFQKMIDIEKEQECGKMANIREYYERALREFGSTNPDLWLSYIKEELNHSEGKPEKCGAIHWRAMKMLQGEDVEAFVNKYTLMQTGHL